MINKFEKKKKNRSLFHAIYLIAKWIWLRSIVGSAFKNSPFFIKCYLFHFIFLFVTRICKWKVIRSISVFIAIFNIRSISTPKIYIQNGAAWKYRNHFNVIKLSWKIIDACQLSHPHAQTKQQLLQLLFLIDFQSLKEEKNDWILRLIPVIWLSCWNAMWHWLLQLDFIGKRNKDYFSPWMTSYFLYVVSS